MSLANKENQIFFLFDVSNYFKPSLTIRHRINRRVWCHFHRDRNLTKWQTEVFSDKCKLKLNSWGIMYVRRTLGRRFDAKYIKLLNLSSV